MHTGNDQWWPWIDISDRGDLNVKMLDRRLDRNSVAHEWPTSRQRPGNYLVWTWAAQCRVSDSTMAAGRACVAPTAAVIPQPAAPENIGNELFPEQTAFPFRNFKVSDVPSNFDYCFRAGVFCGDYESIAVSHGKAGHGRRRCQGLDAVDRRPQRPLVRRAGRRAQLPVAAGPEPDLRAVGRLRRQLRRS